MVEDVNAMVASSHYTIEKSMGATMGDESTIVCNEGYQMVANFSMKSAALETTGLKAVQDVKVICGRDGEWERPFQYNCIDRDIFAQVRMPVHYFHLRTMTLCTTICQKLIP